MNPDKTSKNESKVDAITAIDRVSIEAYIFAIRSIIFAMFDTLIAVLVASSFQEKEKKIDGPMWIF